MAGGADAAKNALESLFNKTKEVVQTAEKKFDFLAETTKEYANVAIGKIIANSGPQTATTNPNPGTEQTNPMETGGGSGINPRGAANN
ncbi:hypothetical protein ACH3XW_37545 [Acanthocheilonema viteae]